MGFYAIKNLQYIIITNLWKITITYLIKIYFLPVRIVRNYTSSNANAKMVSNLLRQDRR